MFTHMSLCEILRVYFSPGSQTLFRLWLLLYQHVYALWQMDQSSKVREVVFSIHPLTYPFLIAVSSGKLFTAFSLENPVSYSCKRA